MRKMVLGALALALGGGVESSIAQATQPATGMVMGEKAQMINSGWQLVDAAKVADPGQTVSSSRFDSSKWYKATVPGTVLTSLVNDGVYPEPLHAENDRPNIIPESLCRTSYWYRTQFAVPTDLVGKHLWLNFEGINYIADVWVDGLKVGTINGAFSRGIFDISPIVTAGQISTLAVKINPPPDPGTPLEQTQANGTGANGGILSMDGATFLCTLGWDWIPGIRDRDMGIWQNVSLSTSGDVVMSNPLVTTDLPLPKTDSADIVFQTTVTNLSNSPKNGVLNGKFGDVTFQQNVSLAPHETRLVKLTPQDHPQLHVNNPALWWPNGYGKPNLYKLQYSFDIDNVSSDSREMNFGIRKITYSVPDSDNLTISVNGLKIICKGGDWGMDEAMKRNPKERLEAEVRFHQLANFNMTRNWVGQSTSEDFYDICDHYGIMIWDEFFQPNRSDGPNVVDYGMYLANVREKVLRFRNHPSIAIWCGRNESDPAPPPVDNAIQQIMAELETTRAYQRNSADGRGVRSGGPYQWRTPREFYAGPPPRAARRGGPAPATTAALVPLEPFKTEIGSVSIPTIESMHAMLDPKDWEIINDDWAMHDLCRGAQEGRNNVPLFDAILGARYGKLANLPDFVRKSQLADYEAFRAMYEGRLSHLFNPCTGVLTWMSNCSQPSMVWQIYSYELEPLSALYASRKACELVHIQMNQDNFHVMVINNTANAIDGLKARIRVLDMDGTVKLDQTRNVTAAATAATDAGAIVFPQGLSPVHFVKVELMDAQNKPVSDNFYWRADPQHPDDFTAMDKMPTVALDSKISRHDADGKCLLDVTLSNPTQQIAVMAHIQLRHQKTNDRVLPVYYDDNYISLLPGESRTISVEAASKDLNGDQPLIALDGWNVTTSAKSSSDSGVNFVLNADAQVSSVPTHDFHRAP